MRSRRVRNISEKLLEVDGREGSDDAVQDQLFEEGLEWKKVQIRHFCDHRVLYNWRNSLHYLIPPILGAFYNNE